MQISYYIITILAAILASGGLWAILGRFLDKRDSRTKLLLGICHDRLYNLSNMYLKRGSISKDELVNFKRFLAEPYFKLGGNGIVKRFVEEVSKLPIRDDSELVRLETDGDM